MQAKQSFFTPLESMRGLAALVVILFHVRWVNPVTLAQFFQNGGLMVDFFFVLSGFVILHSYGERIGTFAQSVNFLWLRLGRLYPLHFASLLAFVGLEIVKYGLQRRFEDVTGGVAFSVNNGSAFVANVFLVQSLGLIKSLTFNFPSWSISTEFYTYVLFATIVLFAGNGRRFVLASGFILVGSIAILLWSTDEPLSQVTYNWGFFRCTAGFFLGALTYRIYTRLNQLQGLQQMGSWLSAGLLASMVILLSLNLQDRLAYAFLPLSAALILSLVLSPAAPVARVLSMRSFAWLGKVSYSIYMVHAGILWLFLQVLFVGFGCPKVPAVAGRSAFAALSPGIGLVVLLTYIGLVLLVSHFTYKWIEVPFRSKSRDLAERFQRS
jgi:peptidoglycan/LPS O-acetylase OafA/YrhL